MATTPTCKSNNKTISVSLGNEVMDRVNDVCENQGCTKSWLITQALNMYFQQLDEDKKDYEMAMAELKEYKENKEKVIPSDEARKFLGL